MSLDSLGDVGIVGVCVLLILREVFSFLKSRDTSPPAPSEDGADCDDVTAKLGSLDESMITLAAATTSIQSLLQKTDADGLPLVYTPRGLTTAMEGLSRSVDRLEQKVDRIR